MRLGGKSYYEGFFTTPLEDNRGDGTEQAIKLALGTVGASAILLLGFLASNGLLQIPPASASNLPISTGASGTYRGTASALRPVLQLDDAVRSALRALPDVRAVEDFLALGYVPDDACIVAGVSKLAAGQSRRALFFIFSFCRSLDS